MEKLVRKFVTDIKLSKFAAVKYSGIVAFFTFTTTFMYVELNNQGEIDVALVRAGVNALVLFIAVYFMCFRIVKYIDKEDEKVVAKRQQEIDEKRQRLEARNGKKINNKKKKKNKVEQ